MSLVVRTAAALQTAATHAASLRRQVDETNARVVAFATPALGEAAARTIAQQPAATPPDLEAAFARFGVHTRPGP